MKAQNQMTCTCGNHLFQTQGEICEICSRPIEEVVESYPIEQEKFGPEYFEEYENYLESMQPAA